MPNPSVGGAFMPNADYSPTGTWTPSGTWNPSGTWTFTTAPTVSGAGTAVSTTATQTLTNKTLTSPAINTPTITTPVIDGVVTGTNSQTKFCTTEFVAVTGTTGTTLTNVVGLTGFSLAASGVYRFDVMITGVGTANSGIKLGFKYTTLTLTDMQCLAVGVTASAVVTVQSTTATDQATLFGNTGAILGVRLSGRITVNVAGTLAVQAAQNAAHADETKVYVGSWANFTRIS
jgi:hypothetical protein